MGTRLLRRSRWQAAKKATWVRKGVGNKADGPFKFGWRAYDGVIHRLGWPAPWRKLHPEALDLEIAFGDLIDRLEPDVVHAHDMHVIGVATRAAGRAKLRGKDLKVVYDAHEYVAGLSRYGARTRRSIAAWANHEREYIDDADRVITVSPAIAQRLQREHKLDHEPTVIMNTPNPADVSVEVPDIRSRLGLASDVPLLVYSGGVTRARGIQTAVQALVDLPDVHLAVVCVPGVATDAVRELQAQAVALEVQDRLHCLDPVKPDEVVAFLRTADVGLIPILRYPSHEMSLPNKLFEYAFAGLPVVVSDMPSMKEFVDRTRIGEVFVAGGRARSRVEGPHGPRRPRHLPRAGRRPRLPAGGVLGRAGGQAARPVRRTGRPAAGGRPARWPRDQEAAPAAARPGQQCRPGLAVGDRARA